MPTQQRLISLQINALKNLKDVTIEFEEDKKLTAILGPNGFGKSTILHVLAASFKPIEIQRQGTIAVEGEDHRYIDFFPNTPHGVWANTDLSIVHFMRNGATTSQEVLSVSKGIRRWLPVASRRPQRATFYIGVSYSLPAIEQVWPRSRLNYVTTDLTDADSLEVKQKAGYILQRDYARFQTNALSNRRNLMGVEYQNVTYSALSMGAGEQRLFKILRLVKSVSDYALILIDELDLLLHTDALHRLLDVLNRYAKAKKLQIIFTTHRESIVDFESFVAIRHLYRSPISPHRTFCFNDTKPDAIYRLTGQITRPVQVSCEDDFSSAIIEKVAVDTGLAPFVQVSRFGAADNCFTLAAALLLSGQDVRRTLLVLDGDKYATPAERQAGIERALTGTEADAAGRRTQALNRIVQFNPTGQNPPEHEIHLMLMTLEMGDDDNENEVIRVAAEVSAEPNSKIRLSRLISRLGGTQSTTLARIIAVAAKSEAWDAYTAPLRTWLEDQKPSLVEQI